MEHFNLANTQAPGSNTGPVTAAAPVRVFGVDLLTVNAGVPRADAMNALSALLAEAADAATERAMCADGVTPKGGSPWLDALALDLARAIARALEGGDA